MNRKLLLMGICLLGSISLSAQHVISGTVTDKKGNPIPGVKIEVPGSGESTISGLDGTFSLETEHSVRKVKAVYAGMQSKTQTVKPSMLIRMGQTNWWNREPQKAQWFINAQAAFPESRTSGAAFGLMFGKVKELGWYVKGVYGGMPSTDCEYQNYWTSGKDKSGFYAATAGVVVRLRSALHFYGGVGYAQRKIAWELTDGCYAKHPDYSYSGVAVDYGLMLKIGRFNISGGTLMSLADECNFIGNVGIGINF